MPARRKNWGDRCDPERPFSSALRDAIAHSQLSAYKIARRIVCNHPVPMTEWMSNRFASSLMTLIGGTESSLTPENEN